MSPSEIRRRTAEKMAQPAKPRNELDLPPGGQPPEHIAKRLAQIRNRCAAKVEARQPAEAMVDETRLDATSLPLPKRQSPL